MSDQPSAPDPTTLYPRPPFEPQQQRGPALASEMRPRPDHGEETYSGNGRLEGRRALITGADSGIGRAVAIAYAREGADVALSYLPQEESDAQDVVALIEKAGRRAVAIPGDLADEAYCVSLVATAVEELGGLDVVVNVGGKQQTQESLLDITTEQLDETFRTNVYSLVWVIKAALPHLAPGASIITTSSVQAYSPSPSLVDYAATKAAINTFSKALAGQLAPQGIRVNVVAPGPVWTPLQVAGGQELEALRDFGGQTPLGRPGQPAELAAAYVFLGSPEASYVVGATISVTGGMPTP
jgi:NAD(P)-dependent dehydrogenase (short-subunit alcohol dehydrogenase family)